MRNILRGAFRRSAPTPPKVDLSSRDFTRMIVTALQRAWWGTARSDSNPAVSGGVAVAAAAHARALSAATVTAPEPVAAAVAGILGSAGAAYARSGEFVARVRFAGDEMRLCPVEITEGHGSITSPVWTVREYDPSGDYRDLRIAGDELLHVVWHPDESGLRGEPPWEGSLARAAANLETGLGDEARMPSGQSVALHSPNEMDDESVAELYDGLYDSLAEAGPGGFWPHLMQGQGTIETGGDSFVKRYGPEFPTAAPQLQETLLGAVLGSCGVPPLLLSMSLGGSALRDGWRAFLSSAAQPVADQLARAATTTLGVDVEIAVSSPQRHQTPADLVSRGRAVKSLTDAGTDLDRALELAGLS